MKLTTLTILICLLGIQVKAQTKDSTKVDKFVSFNMCDTCSTHYLLNISELSSTLITPSLMFTSGGSTDILFQVITVSKKYNEYSKGAIIDTYHSRIKWINKHKLLILPK